MKCKNLLVMMTCLLFLSQAYGQGTEQLRNWFIFAEKNQTQTAFNLKFEEPNFNLSGSGVTNGGSMLAHGHAEYQAMNAYYDDYGDLKFWVISKDDKTWFYDKNHNIIPCYDDYSWTWTNHGPSADDEITLFPLPGWCDVYVVIVGGRLYQVDLNATAGHSLGNSGTNGAVRIISNYSVYFTGLSMGAVVGLPPCGGSAYAHAVTNIDEGNKTFDLYHISSGSNQFGLTTTISRKEIQWTPLQNGTADDIVYSINSSLKINSDPDYGIGSYNEFSSYMSEMEISPDGKKIAIASDVKIAIIQLDQNGWFYNDYFYVYPNTNDRVSGLEFNKISDKMAWCIYNTANPQAYSQSILYADIDFNVSNGLSNITGVNNTVSFERSQLELGRDGSIYALSSNQIGALSLGSSVSFTTTNLPSGFTIPKSQGYVHGVSCSSIDAYFRTLPDQVDGWEYINYLGNSSGAPTYTLSPNPSCGGDAVTVTPSGTPTNGTYKWYDANDNLLAISNTYIVPAITGSFTSPVTTTLKVSSLSDEGCESDKATVSVIQYPDIIADAGPDVTACSGEQIDLLGAGMDASGALLTNSNCQWIYDGTVVSTDCSYSFNAPVVTTQTQLTYTLKVSDLSTPCTMTDDVVVTVNPLPVADAADQVVCGGDPILLSGMAKDQQGNPIPGASCEWFYGGSSYSTDCNTSSLTSPSTWPVNATFYLVVTDPVTGCKSESEPVDVTIKAVPSAPTVSNDEICPGGIATIEASGSIGGTGITYNVWDAATGGNLLGSTPLNVSPSVTTNYYIEAENAEGCAGNRSLVTITVHPQPTVPTGMADITACSNIPVTITGSGSTGGTGIQYYVYDVATGGTALGVVPYDAGTITANTDFYIEAVNAAGCKSTSRKKVTVTVNTIPPTPDIDPSPAYACYGEQVQLSVLPHISGTTYEWYDQDPGPGPVLNGTPVSTQQSYTTPPITAETDYWIIRKDANGCFSNRTLTTVYLIGPAEPVITLSSGTIPICDGQQNVTLSVSNIDPGDNYVWEKYVLGSGYVDVPNSANQASITVNSGGTYRVFVTDAGSGCERSSQQFNVTTYSVPAIISAAGTTVCPNNTVAITANPINCPNSNLEYIWWYDDGINPPVQLNGTWSTSCTIQAGNPGDYYFDVRTNYGCLGTSDPVTINAAPDLLIDPAVGMPAPITLSVSSQSSSFYTGYQWTYNGTNVGSQGQTSYPVTQGTEGYYSVDATFTCNGQPSTSNVVFVPPMCAPNVYNTDFRSSNSPYNISGTYTFDGTVTIPAGVTVNITNSTIYMNSQGSCAEIIIEPRGKLVLDNTVIQGCSTWKGITVQGNDAYDKSSLTPHGQLVMRNASAISDALIGVHSEDGGDISIDNSTFSNNGTHIAVGKYANGTTYYDHGATITESTFGGLISGVTAPGCTPFTPNSSYTAASKHMIYMEDVLGVDIALNSFQGTGQGEGAVAIDGHGLKGDVYIAGNSFTGPLETGVYVSGDVSQSSGITIHDNDFGSPAPGAVNPTNGVIFKEVESSLIGQSGYGQSNHFAGLVNGLQFYSSNGSSSITTTASSNFFEDNTYGIVIAPDVYPITTGISGAPNSINDPATFSNTIWLSMDCNKFFNNDYGIIGTGFLMDQGDRFIESGNNFDDGSGTSSNQSDVFFITAGGGSTDFYYYPNSGFNLNTNSGNTAIDINYDPFGPFSPSNSVTARTVSTPTCYGTWKRAPSDIEPTTGDVFTVNLYPNPASDKFNIELTGTGRYIMQCWDGIGRKLIDKPISTGITTIDCDTWPSGVYHVKIIDQNGRENVVKITKTR